jgi:hypothetical protein
MTGRPTDLTPETQGRIIEALRAGNYIDVACAYAGIGTSTYYRWMQRALDPDAPDIYREFREAVQRARAEAEIRNVGLIQRAASDGTWQAAAWFLERSHPRKWGRHDRHEVTGPDGGPLEVAVDAESLEARLAAIIARRRGTDETDAVVEQ